MKFQHKIELLIDEVGQRRIEADDKKLVGQNLMAGIANLATGVQELQTAVMYGLMSEGDLAKYPLSLHEVFANISRKLRAMQRLCMTQEELGVTLDGIEEELENLMEIFEADADDNEDCAKFKQEVYAYFERADK